MSRSTRRSPSDRADPSAEDQLADRAHGGRTTSRDDIAIIRPEEIRQFLERQALVIAENGKPITAWLTRCIDGPTGRRLLSDQNQLRTQLTGRRHAVVTDEARARAAL